MALDWIRRRQRALARGVVALFCLVWLQAALLPCAMALVPGGMADAPSEHCSYCPPQSDAGNELGSAGVCTYPDGPQVDSRVVGLASPLLLAVPVASFVLEVASNDDAPLPVYDRPLNRTGATLAVSFCRFLK